MLGSPWLNCVDERLAAVIRSDGPTTQAIMAYLAETRGKRLRPLLVYMWAQALSEERDQPAAQKRACTSESPRVMRGRVSTGNKAGNALVDLGAAVELVHLASLLHDDVIDGAAERRGVPTVNTAWGPATAVLSGDYLFAAAFAMLVDGRQFRALGILARTLKSMSESEVEQLAGLFDPTPDEARYWRCVQGKTACLFAAACEAGAVAAGVGPVQRALARRFGMHLGAAFQIADDLADVVGRSDRLGKPVGQDLGRGLITLPVLFLLKRTEHAPRLRQLISERNLGPHELAWVREAALSSGAASYTQAAAAGCIEQARDCLRALRGSGYPKARALLEPIAGFVLASTLGQAWQVPLDQSGPPQAQA
jgi:geranylgeranyl pyrophosphate synthase